MIALNCTCIIIYMYMEFHEFIQVLLAIAVARTRYMVHVAFSMYKHVRVLR